MINLNIFSVFIFLFGVIWGSFLNVVIYRLPRNKMMSSSRSKCTSCDKTIAWYENIPLLSYLFLKGRCSGCSSKISIRYPLVELLAGISCLFVFRDFSNLATLPQYLLYFSVLCTFIALFFIDIEHKLLPNFLTGYLAICFLMIGVINYNWQHWLVGGLIGFLFPLSVTFLFYKLKGQIGLGGGDIKLFGALGLILGPLGIIHNIFLSCFLGSIFALLGIALKKMSSKETIPFGPFIIIVAIFQIFFSHLYNRLINFILS